MVVSSLEKSCLFLKESSIKKSKRAKKSHKDQFLLSIEGNSSAT